MLKIVVATILVLSAAPAFARGGGGGHSSGHSSSSTGTSSGTGSNSSSHTTRGYTNSHGTYVAPHEQTNPNGTIRDNYSAKGNVNPSTGAVGTRLVP